MKIPNTRPNWRTGRYSVVMGESHEGYFRQYQSAWLWVNYLAVTAPLGTVLQIRKDGRTVTLRTVRIADDLVGSI